MVAAIIRKAAIEQEQSDACMNSAESRGKSTEGQHWTTKREETLESIAFTLNHIWLQDHQANIALKYAERDEEDMQMPMAAEELAVQD